MAAPETGGWRLPDAREKLDEIIEAALNSAPQKIIDSNGQPVVVISEKIYNDLLKGANQDNRDQGTDPDIKEYLLREGKGPSEDPLDEFIDD